MKTAIILAVHDRIDDLDAHLDILDFAPKEWQKIIVWSDPKTPVERIDKWKERAEVIKIDGKDFTIGPLLAFTSGLRTAKRLGCDYCMYRNADDWLFNHDSVVDRLAAIVGNGFLFSGYNWVTHGSMREFALNEITAHVDTFYGHLDEMDRSFANSSIHTLCEFKIARWVNRLIDKSKLLRLVERERPPGVGHDLNTLAFNPGKTKLPDNWQEKWKDNHRFFHRQWQLIGSHCQSERYELYKSIRGQISYKDELEQKPEFRRWILAAQKKLPWNLSTSSNHSGGRKIHSTMGKPTKVFPMHIPSVSHD